MIDVVAAVIVRNGRLLLTQCAPEQDAPWLWHCPGGKCDGPMPFGCVDRPKSITRKVTPWGLEPPPVDGESWEDAAIRETREELGLDGPITVPRDEHGNVIPIAELAYERGSEGSVAIWIAWYAVDIGDQKPLPIEGIGVGWFGAGDLCRMAARSGQSEEARASRLLANAMLTEPTERVLPILLEHLRRCAPTPVSLPNG